MIADKIIIPEPAFLSDSLLKNFIETRADRVVLLPPAPFRGSSPVSSAPPLRCVLGLESSFAAFLPELLSARSFLSESSILLDVFLLHPLEPATARELREVLLPNQFRVRSAPYGIPLEALLRCHLYAHLGHPLSPLQPQWDLITALRAGALPFSCSEERRSMCCQAPW